MKSIYAFLVFACTIASPAFATERTHENFEDIFAPFASCYTYCQMEYRDCIRNDTGEPGHRAYCSVTKSLCLSDCRDRR